MARRSCPPNRGLPLPFFNLFFDLYRKSTSDTRKTIAVSDSTPNHERKDRTLRTQKPVQPSGVAGFFELFGTVLVEVILFQLGMVSRKTAVRVIYLDAILFLGSVVVGTSHYWHDRGLECLNESFVRFLERMRMPGDVILVALGVVPMVIATAMAYRQVRMQAWKVSYRMAPCTGRQIALSTILLTFSKEEAGMASGIAERGRTT